jgi:hypothetical protein
MWYPKHGTYTERDGMGNMQYHQRLDYDEASIRAREERTKQVHAENRKWRQEQVAKGGKLIGGIWVYPDTPEFEEEMRIASLEKELADTQEQLQAARQEAEDHCARADEAERERDLLQKRLVELEPPPPVPTPATLGPVGDKIAADLQALLARPELAAEVAGVIGDTNQKAAAPPARAKSTRTK